MGGQSSEKREFARVKVELPVTFSGDDVAGGGLLTGLSVKGCSVITDDLMLAGTPITLHIQLPAQYAALKVDLAVVRWAQGRECGLEFVRLRLEEKQRLQRFIKAVQRRQPGASGRDPG